MIEAAEQNLNKKEQCNIQDFFDYAKDLNDSFLTAQERHSLHVITSLVALIKKWSSHTSPIWTSIIDITLDDLQKEFKILQNRNLQVKALKAIRTIVDTQKQEIIDLFGENSSFEEHVILAGLKNAINDITQIENNKHSISESGINTLREVFITAKNIILDKLHWIDSWFQGKVVISESKEWMWKVFMKIEEFAKFRNNIENVTLNDFIDFLKFLIKYKKETESKDIGDFIAQLLNRIYLSAHVISKVDIEGMTRDSEFFLNVLPKEINIEWRIKQLRSIFYKLLSNSDYDTPETIGDYFAYRVTIDDNASDSDIRQQVNDIVETIGSGKTNFTLNTSEPILFDNKGTIDSNNTDNFLQMLNVSNYHFAPRKRK